MNDAAYESTASANEPLIALIRSEIIANGGQIVFAHFMELALYHPKYGYYMSASRRPGRSGDFITSPEASPHFGHMLARQIAEFWERLGKPANWVIREHGAGISGLAYDIMAGLDGEFPPAFDGLTYELVELNPGQRREALQAMTQAGLAGKVVMKDPFATSTPITGVVLANEVADALPVHRLVMTDDGLQEAWVRLDGDGFCWERSELSLIAVRPAQYLEEENITPLTGSLIDVSPAARLWMKQIASKLERGYLLVIDYGYEAQELYRGHRLQGTIRGYFEHTVTDDPFIRVGQQDLTAHVDFTALRRAGESSGMTFAGFTTQGAFLSSLGLGDVLVSMQDDPQTTAEEYLATQAVVMRLIDPGGLGRFGVLIMGRDVPLEPPLRGFLHAPPSF